MRTLAVVMVSVLVATGCASLEGQVARDGKAGTATLVDELAAAGIAVYRELGDSKPLKTPAEPVSPVRLLEWQTHNLARETRNHAGTSARDLDAVVEGGKVGKITITPSRLIAGWAKHGTTPAAKYARRLLGKAVDKPRTAVFPQGVLLLFTSDLATAGAALAEAGHRPRGGGGSPAGAPQPALSAPCYAVLNFVNGAIARVFNAIGHLRQPKANTGVALFDALINTIGKFVTDAVNVAIDGAYFVVSNTVRVAIAPVMAIVARIAGIVGTLGEVASAVRVWTPVMTADPSANRKAIGTEAPLPGLVKIRIDLGGFDEWPPAIADCATQAGAPLPPLKPVGNRVTWNFTTGDLITSDTTDSALDKDSSATAEYHTTVEPKYKKAKQHQGQATIRATVRRDDTTKLEAAFAQLVHDGVKQLAPPVGNVIYEWVWPYVKPEIDKAFAALAEFRDVTGTIAIPVSYHTPEEDDKKPPPPPSQQTSIDSCLLGQWTTLNEHLTGVTQTMSVSGGTGAVWEFKPDGSATVNFDSQTPLVGASKDGPSVTGTTTGRITWPVKSHGNKLRFLRSIRNTAKQNISLDDSPGTDFTGREVEYSYGIYGSLPYKCKGDTFVLTTLQAQPSGELKPSFNWRMARRN